MTIKKLVLVKRKSGLTPEEFREGYENSHAKMAEHLYGHIWLEYRRNYITSGINFCRAGEEGPDEIMFDAISEIVLPDADAIKEVDRISAANIEMIKEDEAKWFDQSHCWLVGCETIEADLRKYKI